MAIDDEDDRRTILRFAFSTLGCPAWPAERVASEGARLGFDGVEYRLLDGRPIDPAADRLRLAEAVRLCRDRGVDVFALATSCGFRSADAPGRSRETEAVRRWVEVASDLRVPTIRVFPFVPHGLDGRAADDTLVESLTVVAPFAREAGVVIGVETHAPTYDSARALGRVISRVGSRAVAAVWDAQHTHFRGEATADVLAALDRRIAYVQVKDARRVNVRGDWEPMLPGRGVVPLVEQVRALGAVGYRGFVSVEWEKFWHPQIAAPEVAFPRYLAMLRSAATERIS